LAQGIAVGVEEITGVGHGLGDAFSCVGDGQDVGHAAGRLGHELGKKPGAALGIDHPDHGGGGQGFDELPGSPGQLLLFAGQGQGFARRLGLGFLPSLVQLGQAVVQGQTQGRQDSQQDQGHQNAAQSAKTERRQGSTVLGHGSRFSVVKISSGDLPGAAGYRKVRTLDRICIDEHASGQVHILFSENDTQANIFCKCFILQSRIS